MADNVANNVRTRSNRGLEPAKRKSQKSKTKIKKHGSKYVTGAGAGKVLGKWTMQNGVHGEMERRHVEVDEIINIDKNSLPF